jgi:hypothetical protein
MALQAPRRPARRRPQHFHRAYRFCEAGVGPAHGPVAKPLPARGATLAAA